MEVKESLLDFRLYRFSHYSVKEVAEMPQDLAPRRWFSHPHL